MQSMNLIGHIYEADSVSDGIKEQPFIVVDSSNIIKEVSKAFVHLVEYPIDELISKNIIDILKTLRADQDINIENIDEKTNYFLFTKKLEFRFVNIQVVNEMDERVYFFREIPNSRFEGNNQFLDRLITENKTGIGVFTASNFTLIKANQTYLNNFPNLYNRKEMFYGKSLKDIIPNFIESPMEKIFNDIVINNESRYYKEIPWSVFNNESRYWNCSITPIEVNNKVDYIVIMAEDVTEHVTNSERIKKQLEIIEQRNKQLEAIFESIDDAIFIIDSDKNYYMTNRSAKEYYPNGEMNKLGDVYDNYKYYDFSGNEIPFKDITVSKLFRGEEVNNDMITLRNSYNTKHISVNGRPIYDSDGKIRFVVMCSRDITESVEAQRIIERQKSELEAIIESIGDMLIVLDKEGNLRKKGAIDINFCGESPERINKFFDFNNSPLSAKDIPSYKVLNEGEKVKNFRMKVVESNREKYTIINGTPIFNTSGEVKLGVFAILDITDLMEKKREIKKQKELLENIINNTSNGIFIYNRSKEELVMNEEAKKLFYEGDSLNSLQDIYAAAKFYCEDGRIISEEDMPACRSLRGEIVNGDKIIVKQHHKENILECKSFPIYNDEGNVDAIITYTHNITELVNQNKVIKQQKDQLEAIINNMQESIFVFDKDGKYIIKNNIANELLGTSVETINDIYSSKELFHIDGSKVLPEEMPFYHAKHGKSIKGKIICFEFNGHKEYIVVNGVPINDSEGNLLYGIVSGLLITDFFESQQNLKLTQEQLLKVEREKNETLEKALEMKDEFLSLVSHEFRTPINVISTAIQALNYIYGNELSDKVKEYLGTIRQNTFRQLRLVNNLLDITRANAGRIKINKKNIDIVFLTKAITESVYDYAAQKGVMVSLSSSFKKKIIGIDDEKYERIILNLISNAIKFTPEGKSISVTLRSVKDKICVEVKDTGIGIPQDKMDIIFDKFGQVDSSLSRQAEGTGIGLSLVKMFVNALGGSVSVKSKVGKGSTFTVLFPNEKVEEEETAIKMENLMNNRLIEVTNVEFSDIYL